jgi:hypothetical protein
MTIHEVLVKARALIADESRWGQDNGDGVPPRCHCAVTAIGAASGVTRDRCGDVMLFDAAKLALGQAAGVSPADCGLLIWNDHHAHAEVLAAFDRAIAATEPTA